MKLSHTTAKINPSIDGKEVTIAGWVQAVRVKGKLLFLVLRDSYGTVQITCFKPKVPEIFGTLAHVTRESSIAIRGHVKAHKEAPGGAEINPEEVEILSAAETPLPFDPFADFIDTKKDTRFDWRFLDLRNPKSLAYHKLRSEVIFAVSNYMREQGFTFWTTPKVLGQSSEGGADVFSVDWYGKDAFLAMSPQLHKQALAGNTGTKFFEITPYFRAEKSRTRRHLAEFTGIDVEIPFSTEEDVWPIAEGIVKTAADTLKAHPKELEIIGTEVPEIEIPFERISYDRCVEMINEAGVEMEWGEDFSTEQERKLGEVVGKPFFVYQFPKEVAKFYVRGVEGEPKKAHAFDLIYKIELTSGAWRENRYDKLVSNLKSKGLDPANFKSYLDFFRYGCAPHAGFGMGIERLLVILLDAPDVQEVVAFPRTVDRLTP